MNSRPPSGGIGAMLLGCNGPQCFAAKGVTLVPMAVRCVSQSSPRSLVTTGDTCSRPRYATLASASAASKRSRCIVGTAEYQIREKSAPAPSLSSWPTPVSPPAWLVCAACMLFAVLDVRWASERANLALCTRSRMAAGMKLWYATTGAPAIRDARTLTAMPKSAIRTCGSIVPVCLRNADAGIAVPRVEAVVCDHGLSERHVAGPMGTTTRSIQPMRAISCEGGAP
eukprot:scaffold133658_cov30-Tisochrysis_lutea.AAC.3